MDMELEGGKSRQADGGGDGAGRRALGLEILNEDPMEMRLVLRGVSSSFANALRRTIMGEVDVLAIDRLQIHENTTMTHDELLFHRLGMIPLRCCGDELDKFVPRHLCNCDDGCDKCQVKFSLHIINRSDELVEVKTKDLTCFSLSVRPVRDDILIVKLGKNQEISFTAYAVKSNSRYENNAKWNPVTVAAYRPTATVTVDSDLMNKFLTPDEQRKVCNSEPSHILQYNEQLRKSEAHPLAHLRATFVGDFMETLADILHPAPKDAEQKHDYSEKKAELIQTRDRQVGSMEEAFVPRHPTELVHPMISMTPRKDEFLFPIVSSGCLSARDILSRALAALKKRLRTIDILSSRINSH